MSGRTARPVSSTVREHVLSPRLVALAGGALLSLSYLAVFYRTVDVAGREFGTGVFVAAVLGSVGLAVLFAGTIALREAVAVGLVLLVAGLAGYMLSVPASAIDLQRQLMDTAALLTGLSILQITRADVWALGLAPAPVFLSGYLFLRRAYALGTLTGGAALALVVLTGDANAVLALVGVLGGALVLGFGRFDVEGGSRRLQNTLLVVLVAMTVVTTSVSLVPGGDARPLQSGSDPTTVEASLTGSPARVNVAGSIGLSPAVRFTVTADESRYWRVGAFDRYTGGDWIRTGGIEPYEGSLPRPEAGNVEPVRQTYQAEATVSAMPAAWKPTDVEAGDREVRVTDLGGIEPGDQLVAGDRYSVTSFVADPPPERLDAAGTDYPPGIEERYLQLPESTPERLGTFTTNLTQSAATPYRKAVVIERWLEEKKNYSLIVDRPPGDVASAFVFEMDYGYCVYYATAMVAMLRTQGVPSRFVVGYTSGQQLSADTWVVRGLDAHAWVEVYFPGEGWVKFDPTPADPRQSIRISRIERARENAEPNVDVNGSLAVPLTPIGGNTSTNVTATNASTDTGIIGEEDPVGTSGISQGSSGGGDDGPLSSPEVLLYRAILLVGAITALHQLGVIERLYRALWLRRLPSGPPGRRIEAAVQRGEYLLSRRYRPRREEETRRAYLESLFGRAPADDGRDRVGRVQDHAASLFRVGERARYAGRATERDAAEARQLLSELREAYDRTG